MKSKIKAADEAFLQPWFLSQEKAEAIRQILPRGYREKMRHYFEDYGCMRCERKDVPYDCNGLCSRCKNKIRTRLEFSARRHLKTPDACQQNSMAIFAKKMRSAQRLLSDLSFIERRSP